MDIFEKLANQYQLKKDRSEKGCSSVMQLYRKPIRNQSMMWAGD